LREVLVRANPKRVSSNLNILHTSVILPTQIVG
jgi:hypothetical protein